MKILTRRNPIPLLAALALTLGACDATESTGPELPPTAEASGSVVIAGLVDASAAPAAVGGVQAAPGAGANGAGITVEVEGTGVSDTTDADGAFRLEVPSGDGTVRIHFRRGDIDATLSLQGLTPGAILEIEVEVEAERASVQKAEQGDHGEFDGHAALVELRGEAPDRVLAMDVRDDDGRTDRVLVREGHTRFHPRGDLDSFEELLRAFEKDWPVEVEGEGRTRDDGVILAVRMKAETEDHDDDDGDDGEFEFDGLAALVEVRGEAPARVAALDVRDDHGRTDRVLVREDSTRFAQDGDLRSFEELLRAFEQDWTVKVEGRGRPTDTGAIVARTLEAEARRDGHEDEHDRPDFAGDAAFVSVRGEAPTRVLRLEVTRNGHSVLVDVVEGRTVLDDDGDFTSFERLLAAAQADVRLEVEGEGVRQDDGSIVASELEAEVKD